MFSFLNYRAENNLETNQIFRDMYFGDDECEYQSSQNILFRAKCILFKSKYKKVGVLPIWKVKSNVSSAGPSSKDLRQKGHVSL